MSSATEAVPMDYNLHKDSCLSEKILLRIAEVAMPKHANEMIKSKIYFLARHGHRELW